jgi:hypothetical protein
LLQGVMPSIRTTPLSQVHDGTLKRFGCSRQGKKAEPARWYAAAWPRRSSIPHEGSTTHTTRWMTDHYSVAQIVELHAALERINSDECRWNSSLSMLDKKGEARGVSPSKFPGQEKRPTHQNA